MSKRFISLLLVAFVVFNFQSLVTLSYSVHAQELVAEATPEPTVEPTAIIEPTPEPTPLETPVPTSEVTPEVTPTPEVTLTPTPTPETNSVASIQSVSSVTAVIPTPTLQVSNPWASNMIGFTVSVSSAEFIPNIYSYEYKVGNTITGTKAMGQYRSSITGPVDISTLPDGPVSIEVRLTDGVDFSNWVSSSVTKDTVAPVISVLSVDNLTNPGQILVKSGDQIKVTFTMSSDWANANAGFTSSDNVINYAGITIGNPNYFIYTIPAGLPNGPLNYWINVNDNASNSTTLNGTNNFVVDNTAPTGTVVVNSGAAYTTSVNVNVDITATDTGSGVAKVELSNDGTSYTAASVGANAWVLDSTIGLKTVYLRITDTVGQSTVLTDTLDLRSGLPTTPVINTSPINSATAGSYTLTGTADPLTTLSYSFNSGAVFGTGSTDVAGNFSIAGIDLSALADGSIQISVVAEDASNVQSNPGLATILKDTIAPSDPTLTVPTLSATNPFVIVGESGTTYEYILSGSTGTGVMASGSQSVLVSPMPSDGTYSLQVRLTDLAGNVSNWVFAQATVDTTPPVVSNISIVNLTVSGSNYIRVGETAQITFTASESLSNSTINLAGHNVINTWTLISTDVEGYLPYTLTLTDAFGNTSTTSGVSNLYFDKTNPSLSFTINGGAAITTNPAVTLNITGSDAGGLLGVWVSNDGLTFTPSALGAVAWTLTPGNGPHTVYVIAYDQAGNSTLVSQSIILNSPIAIVTSGQGNTIDTSRIEISWTTDRPAAGFVRYGTQPGVYTSTSSFDGNMTTSHRIELSGLSPETTYYWQIVIANSTNTAQYPDSVESSNRTFRQAQACDGGCSAPSAPSNPTAQPTSVKTVAVYQPSYTYDYFEEVMGESTTSVELTPTPTVTPIVTPAVLGEVVATPSAKLRVINWWFILLLLLILLIILAWYLASKLEDKEKK